MDPSSLKSEPSAPLLCDVGTCCAAPSISRILLQRDANASTSIIPIECGGRKGSEGDALCVLSSDAQRSLLEFVLDGPGQRRRQPSSGR